MVYNGYHCDDALVWAEFDLRVARGVEVPRNCGQTANFRVKVCCRQQTLGVLSKDQSFLVEVIGASLIVLYSGLKRRQVPLLT